jgi:cob(I)alamin adenosyltransferase
MSEYGTPPTVPVPLYAATIHHCVSKGDLDEMKALVIKAEKHLKDHGDVAAALKALQAEIAKLEAEL